MISSSQQPMAIAKHRRCSCHLNEHDHLIIVSLLKAQSGETQ
jgi:hypothetical protein